MTGAIDTQHMADARVQLHWASQVLAATSDAVLEKEPDDSQSSLSHVFEYQPDQFQDRSDGLLTHEFPSGQHLLLGAGTPEIAIVDSATGDALSFSLAGKTLQEAIDWVSRLLPDIAENPERTITLRDYEMPAHAFGKGAPFEAGDAAAFGLIGNLLNSAFGHLSSARDTHGPATDLLLWPHHFDLGSILLFAPEDDPGKDPCVGIGFSLGDDNIGEPYYYANPYSVEKPASLPTLPTGAWTDKWFGGVLLEREIGTDAGDAVGKFIAGVTDLTRQLKG